jgi:hypothetical protein
MDDRCEPEAASTAESFTPRQLRLLKLAIVVMSALLIIGFAAVLGRIVYLVAVNPHPASVAAGTIPARSELPLPPGAVVRSLSLSGDRLAVHFDSPAGAGIAIVDLARGQAISHIELTERAPRP